MVSGYVTLTDDEVQNLDEGEVNEVDHSEKMIYEVNQNGNNMQVDRSEDPQMKTNATTVTTDGDARSDGFSKVTIEDDEGSPEDQAAFIGKLGTYYREKAMEFKPPRFYGYQLNCLKLWRSVIRLGGYDRETGLKLWRQVGDSFKTCTIVSWTFRSFYEKLLLQDERHMKQNGELQLPTTPLGSSGVDNEGSGYQISASGRAVRDSAARCRLGRQEQHFLVMDRSANNMPKSAKSLKTSGSLKHQGQNEVEHPMKAAETETSKPISLSLSVFGSSVSDVKINFFPYAKSDVQVVDVGPPADWVKINVREIVNYAFHFSHVICNDLCKHNDSFEVSALVPGLLRDEVRVQSDPAGRLVITGQPNQLDNLWGVTAFKKMVTLPARIDQLRTNAVVTLHGCLHVHMPFAQQNL
ncbi:hypothetical protein R3W88_000677 [Solanum pinnatisectum]|uniref:Uncharacterized protein n=1 Tax=Solanum pinnatisectum TaxID=50273 RepID=A0AAV9MIY4_9SOLN|nr:hypothetical protein R3W88_000677 [Solanum pinnatisectum]